MNQQIDPRKFIKEAMETGFSGEKQDEFEMLITLIKYSDRASLTDKRTSLLLNEKDLKEWLNKRNEH